MEYQKIINLQDNTPNQPSKFRTRNWLEINDESPGKYNNKQIKTKTAMVRSILCDFSYANILVSTTTTIDGKRADNAAKLLDKRNKGVIFKIVHHFLTAQAK